jgi:protein-tyrosine phosphatase
MRAVPGHSIWMGHAGDGRNLASIHEMGIRMLVDLAADEKPPAITRDLIFCRFPLVDASGNPPALLALAVSTVADGLKWQLPTLIFCSAGMSRTPAVLACAMARFQQKPPAECLSILLAGLPSDVSPGLWQELVQHTVESRSI